MADLFRVAMREASSRRCPGDPIAVRHSFAAGPFRRRWITAWLRAAKAEGLTLRVTERDRSWLSREHEVFMQGPWPLVVQAARAWDRLVRR